MKIDIPKIADVQTAFRLPKEDWEKIKKTAKESKCSNSDVLRHIISEFFRVNL